MRFSLGTLIVIAIWFGSAGLVWALRQPWVVAPWPEKIKHPKSVSEFYGMTQGHPARSPDGTRVISGVNPSDGPEWRMGFWIGDAKALDIVSDHLESKQKKISLEEFKKAQSRQKLFFSGAEYFGKDGKWTNLFLDDDTIALYLPETGDSPGEHRGMRRRFPEWWWGHFYRPEVWAFLVLTGVLIIRIIRARRMRGKTTSTLSA